MENTCPHSLLISGLRCCTARQWEYLCWSLILEGQLSSEVQPLQFPLAHDCYLDFQWRLAVPLGRHECACQQEFIGGNRGRWRMVSSCCCFSLCVKMSPLIQPPSPFSPPSPPCACCLCLLVRWFLLSCQRQHYHILVAWETSAERQRLKTLMVFEASKHERLSTVQWELESSHIWKGLIVGVFFFFFFSGRQRISHLIVR